MVLVIDPTVTRLLALADLLAVLSAIGTEAQKVYEARSSTQREVADAKPARLWPVEAAMLWASGSTAAREHSMRAIESGQEIVAALIEERLPRVRREDHELLAGVVGAVLKLRVRSRGEVRAFLEDMREGRPATLVLDFDGGRNPGLEAERRAMPLGG